MAMSISSRIVSKNKNPRRRIRRQSNGISHEESEIILKGKKGKSLGFVS
jgi:hypothetical protein